MRLASIFIAMIAAPGLAADLTAAQHKMVDEAISAQLKDPYSAKFTKRRSDGLMVCGYVNAKNSYGGYVGDSPYHGFFMKGQFFVLTIARTGVEHRQVIDSCRRSGLPL